MLQRSSKLLSLALGVAMLLPPPAPASTLALDGVATRRELVHGFEGIAGEWASLWNAQRLDQILRLYAHDAVFLASNGARVAGPGAIRTLLRDALRTFKADLQVRSLTAERSGDLAFDSGEYRETLTPLAPGGARRDVRGHYLMVYRRQDDGRWLIAQQAWTEEPPAQ